MQMHSFLMSDDAEFTTRSVHFRDASNINIYIFFFAMRDATNLLYYFRKPNAEKSED